jgi:hypothetical protein
VPHIVHVVGAILGATAAGALPGSVLAQSDEVSELLAGGAWHAKSVPCSEGIVEMVTPRLMRLNQTVFTADDFEQSGVAVRFRLPSQPRFIAGVRFPTAVVMHYQNTAGNEIMRAERAGDHVQVCLTAYPLPRVNPRTGAVVCDPDRDARGLVFRVYDYRQHSAYIGSNSQHLCGGA